MVLLHDATTTVLCSVSPPGGLAHTTPRSGTNRALLDEHLHHNYHRNKGVAKGKYSPHARKYVREYEEWLEKNGGGKHIGTNAIRSTLEY